MTERYLTEAEIKSIIKASRIAINKLAHQHNMPEHMWLAIRDISNAHLSLFTDCIKEKYRT